MSYPEHNDYPVAKKVESLYQGRIRQFNDANGQYRDLNLPHYYDRTRIDNGDYIKLNAYDVPDFQRPSFSAAIEQAEGNWRPVSKGDWFGPSWSTHWFKIELRIPSDWPQKYQELPVLDFDSSDEGFLYTEDGQPVHGLSGEHKRTEYIISEDWVKDGEWHTLYIETSCNDISGVGTPPDANRQFQLRRADLVVPNSGARALNIDYWLLGDAAREFPGNSWQKNKAFDLLNRIVNTFNVNNVDESIAECRKLAATYFGDVNSPEVFRKKSNSILEQNLVWAVGNCHIDTAWLWPFAETRRKIARSWSSQLDLLDRYPEYVFVASQAVQFQWLKEDHPDLFARVKRAVKHGRFIPIGGSWVECDTNMPSGESLVRQMLLGQKFFQKEFGVRSKVFWLPDTFGYAPQLPQICRQAGQPYFLTQKLSWNNIDVFPLSTFSWVGLDGSQVACHMPPTNTYTAEAHFGDVKRTIEQHKNLDTSQDSMMLFGYGDGGGGPTAEMLEKLRRCRGIANETGLLPGAASGLDYTPENFFDTIVAKSNSGKELPSWKGELYLEYHRGTYTTQAAIKKGNRQSEILMRDLELFATAASLKTDDYHYPYAEIEELWRLVCLNQFHDVLPGSGIEMIYEDARNNYREIHKKGSKLVKQALNALGYETADHKTGLLVTGADFIAGNQAKLLATSQREAHYNVCLPLNFWMNDIITNAKYQQALKEGAGDTAESLSENEAKQDVFENRDDAGDIVESLGENETEEELEEEELEEEEEEEEEVYAEDEDEDEPEEVTGKLGPSCADEIILKNDNLSVKFVSGQVVSIYDIKNNREVLHDGGFGNQFILYEDQPMNFPAWDTEQYATEKYAKLVPEKWHQSSVDTVEIAFNFGNSKLHQLIILHQEFVEFKTAVDWHESYQFLKVEFPVDIESDFASYETSFGVQRRPTHFNTSWDSAKFEVSGHRFADLSEWNYGVSLLNDCKYGYSIHGKRMRLSLLRSSKSPDTHADMGKHTFRYALYPHAGPLAPRTVQLAQFFNHPHYWVKHPKQKRPQYAGKTPTQLELTHHKYLLESIPHVVMVEGADNVVISSVKRADADSRSRKKRRAVVRLYETMGGRGRGHLSCLLDIRSARKVNVLEDMEFQDDKEEEEAEFDILTGSETEADLIPFELKPFEVVTILIEFA